MDISEGFFQPKKSALAFKECRCIILQIANIITGLNSIQDVRINNTHFIDVHHKIFEILNIHHKIIEFTKHFYEFKLEDIVWWYTSGSPKCKINDVNKQHNIVIMQNNYANMRLKSFCISK